MSASECRAGRYECVPNALGRWPVSVASNVFILVYMLMFVRYLIAGMRDVRRQPYTKYRWGPRTCLIPAFVQALESPMGPCSSHLHTNDSALANTSFGFAMQVGTPPHAAILQGWRVWGHPLLHSGGGASLLGAPQVLHQLPARLDVHCSGAENHRPGRSPLPALFMPRLPGPQQPPQCRYRPTPPALSVSALVGHGVLCPPAWNERPLCW